MARDYVKDLKAVQELNNAMDDNLELLASMTGAGENLANTIMGVADAHKGSRKYKKENLNIAKKQSKIGKAMIGVIKAQEKGSKIGMMMAKAKLKFASLRVSKEDKISKNMLKQFKLQQEERKEAEKKKKDEAAKAGGGGVSGMMGGGIFGTIFGIFGKIFDYFWGMVKGFAAKIDKLGETFGVQGVELQEQFLDMEVRTLRIGINLEKLITYTRGLSGTMGITLTSALDMAGAIADSTIAMGLTDEKGAKLYGTMMKTMKISQKTAEHLLESTAALAKAEGLDMSGIMSDVADNTEMVSRYSRETFHHLRRSAIQAAKMGLNLSTVDKVSKSMLNFQSSIQAVMTANVALGTDINFHRARELFLTHQQDRAMEEVQKQLKKAGGLSQFNRLEQELLAEAFGMSFGELKKMDNTLMGINRRQTFEDMVGSDTMSSLKEISYLWKQISATIMKEFAGPFERALKKISEFFSAGEGQQWIINLIEWVEELGSKFETKMMGLADSATTKLKELDYVFKSMQDPWDWMFGDSLEDKALEQWKKDQGVYTDWSGVERYASGTRFAAATDAPEFLKEWFPGTFGTPGVDQTSMARFRRWGGVEKYMEENPDWEPPMNDFISRPGQAPQRFSGQDTIIGAKGKLVDIDIKPLQEEIKALRRDMAMYFGVGGTAIRGIGAKTGQEIANMS